MRKRARFMWVGIGLGIVAMLLINPSLTNPAVEPGQDMLSTNPPPAEIASLLKNACYDCHSDETAWPWYGRVAPVSWWLVDHVNKGRQELNFSDWPHDDPRRAARRWRNVSHEVSSGAMPLPSYTWGHPKARLSAEQRRQLADWATQEAERIWPVPQE